MKLHNDHLDALERAREKAASRDSDADALASGRKSRAQLCAENGAFGFPRERVRIEFGRVKPKL